MLEDALALVAHLFDVIAQQVVHVLGSRVAPILRILISVANRQAGVSLASAATVLLDLVLLL